MGRFQLTAGRSLRLAVFLFAVLALAALWLRNKNAEPPESDTDARIAFYSARAAGRGSYPAYARLGAAYLQKARETGNAKFYGLAEQNLTKSNQFQLNFEAIRSLAALSLDLHRFSDALRYAQETVQTMPGDLESQGLLFDAQLVIGRTKDASATLEKMVAAGKSFGTLTRQANLHELRGDLPGALANIEGACQQAEQTKMSPQAQAWCQVRLGSLKLLANCDASAAEAAYQRALQFLPNYFLAREHLAEMRAAQGNYVEAVRLYRQLVETSASPSYRLALADVLAAQRQTQADEAERAAARKELLAQQQSGNRQHLLELAFLLLDSPDAAGSPAGEHKREALKIAMDEVATRHDLFALDALAWAQFRNAQISEALANIEEALRDGTKNAAVLLHAAEILLAAGQKARAAQLLEEVQRCPLALTPGERAALQQLKARLAN